MSSRPQPSPANGNGEGSPPPPSSTSTLMPASDACMDASTHGPPPLAGSGAAASPADSHSLSKRYPGGGRPEPSPADEQPLPVRTPGGSMVPPAGGSAFLNHRHRPSSSFHPPPLTPKTYSYPNQSHSTIAEVAEAFRVITNESGFDAAALGKLMRAHGQHPSDDEVKDLIKAIDQRGDGVVRFSEFTALMAQPIELEEIDDMKQAFLEIDKEQRGWVAAAEFLKLFANYGEKSTPEECDEMLAFADPDDTGRVDYNSFLSTLAYRLMPRM